MNKKAEFLQVMIAATSGEQRINKGVFDRVAELIRLYKLLIIRRLKHLRTH